MSSDRRARATDLAGRIGGSLASAAASPTTPLTGVSSLVRPTVGSVLGLSLADARAAIGELGATVRDREVDVTEAAGVGRVVAQRPVAGEPLPETQVVELDVGRAARQQVQVPDLSGRSVDDARAAVGALGLSMRTEEEEASPESGVASRDILRQAPPAGSVAPAGSEVVVAIAKVVVGAPGVTGKPEAEARRAIEAAGLLPVVGERREAASTSGTVVEQRPAAGVRVEPGTRVELVLSAGPRSVAAAGRPPAIVPRAKWEKQGHTLEVSDMAIIDEHQRLAREAGVLKRRGGNPSFVVRAALRAFERLRRTDEEAWLRHLRDVGSTGEPGQG